MLREDIRKLKTEPQELRKFGLLVGGAFALLAAWCFWRGKPFAPYLLIPAILLVSLGAVWPKSLKWVYLPWMVLGLVLGLIVSTVLLTAFFFLVVTPIGLAARLMGKDFLDRRLNKATASYWLPRNLAKPRQAQDYERQF